jgi:hydrogenase nickel incorporation protein HypB
MEIITLERAVLKKNDEVAAENRAAFRKRGIFSFNLLSSPGSGKTSILEKTIARLKDELKIAVIEGDVQTDLDAQRIAKHGVPVIQVVTNGTCHLDAKMIQDALPSLALDELDIVIIENVGNLICPSSYDLGEDVKIVMASTTEGEDKPLKYPAMFRKAEVMIINKIDLLPYVPFSMEALKRNALRINPNLRIFETSCLTNEGIDTWCEWIVQRRASSKL